MNEDGDGENGEKTNDKDDLNDTKLEKNDNSKCRLQAKDYLDCRMNKNLMEKRDLSVLGYKDVVDNNK